MIAQGWLTGPASGYDRRTALYTEDFLGYFKAAWPERWDKFAKTNPNNPDGVLVQKLVRGLEQDGTLDVLRHGFKLPGVKIETCSFKPDHGMNPDTLKRYQCNRLRVVPEVSYSIAKIRPCAFAASRTFCRTVFRMSKNRGSANSETNRWRKTPSMPFSSIQAK